MRFAIIAAAGWSATADPRLGERDAMLVRSRFEMEDLGYEVVAVDPNEDLAVQIEDHLAERAGQIDDLLLYVSCLLAVVPPAEDAGADDATECFLCLDPAQPDVGDALGDVVEVISGRARRATLVIADLRHEDASADRAVLGAALEALVSTAARADGGVELIAALRPIHAHPERIPSRLTAGLLEAIDDRTGPLSARQAYATLIQRQDLGSWPHAVAHRAGGEPFALRDEAHSQPPEARAPSAPPARDPSPLPPPQAPPPAPAPAPPIDLGPAPPGSEAMIAEIAASLHHPPPRSQDFGLAPVSERIEATSTTVPVRKKPRDPVSIPKVVIGKSDRPASEPPAASSNQPPMSTDPAVSSGAASSPHVGPVSSEPAVSSERRRKGGLLYRTAAEGPDAKRMAADAQAAMDALRDAGELPHELEEPEEISIEEEIEEHRPKTKTGAPPPPPNLRKKAAEMTVDDHIEAGDLERALNHDDQAVEHYKKGLAKLGTVATPERAVIYLRIADVLRKNGKTRLAISNYDKALSITPTDRVALAGLIELNAETGNWRSVYGAEQKFLAGLSDEERLTELLASGERWLERGDDVRRAKERFTEARDAFPDELEPLRRLIKIHDREKNLELALESRKTLATRTENPRECARLWFELGEQFMFEMHRERDAVDAFERALDADPMMLEALEVLATALADAQEWGELERVYEKMVEKFAGREQTDATKTILGELHHRLALLFRHHLDDPELALDALERELQFTRRAWLRA